MRILSRRFPKPDGARRARKRVLGSRYRLIALALIALPSTGLDPIHFNKPAPNFVYDTGDGLRSLSESAGLPVLVITLSDEAPGVARAYLEKQGIDLPVSEDADHKVWSLYGVRAIPVSAHP